MKDAALTTALALALSFPFALSQSSYAPQACSPTLTASYSAPSVAPGYVARLVANNLTAPRGIKFDGHGSLLVVEQGVGITALNVSSNGDCLTSSGRKTVVSDATLNHGIEISPDGSVLYASSSEAVYSWSYSHVTQSNTSAPRTLVNNMTGTDHTTRTLLLSKKVPGMLVVTRGSISNIDPAAEQLASGHSQVKSFNLLNATAGPYDFDKDGLLLGWGLRNDVGVDEEPLGGGIYTVENSADDVERSGQDVHQNNPGEELNFLGYLNGTASVNQGKNFGYPECFAAWDPSAIPDFNGTVGQQFAIGTPNATVNDAVCAQRQAPRLTFQAHMAPLDILFNAAGTAAWITFHGSWDRTDPVGYKLGVVEFADGQPVAPSNSTTALLDVVSNHDNSVCPDGCFRPVGLAWDRQGRLFMSSDSTGEIYAILRADANATESAGSNATGTLPSPSASGPSGYGSSSSSASGSASTSTSASSPSSTSSAASPSSTGVAAVTAGMSTLAVLFASLAFLM